MTMIDERCECGRRLSKRVVVRLKGRPVCGACMKSALGLSTIPTYARAAA